MADEKTPKLTVEELENRRRQIDAAFRLTFTQLQNAGFHPAELADSLMVLGLGAIELSRGKDFLIGRLERAIEAVKSSGKRH